MLNKFKADVKKKAANSCNALPTIQPNRHYLTNCFANRGKIVRDIIASKDCLISQREKDLRDLGML